MQEDIGFVISTSNIDEYSVLLDIFLRKGGRIVGVCNAATAAFYRALKGSLIEVQLYSAASNNKLSKFYIQNSKSILGRSKYSCCFQIVLEMLDVVLVQKIEAVSLWMCLQWIHRCINSDNLTFKYMVKLHIIFEIELMNFLGETDVFQHISEKLALEYHNASSYDCESLNSRAIYSAALSREDYIAVTSFTDAALQRYDKSVKNIRKTLIFMRDFNEKN
ncbi:hypothetical protein Fsol_00334 [Candidatus Fokinia solitaria]|uniref:DNA repair protein RecO n=1 Tax=Candidatus Fokinia solitaria TaxID=1802984 RepID=A0A2U8BS17_9RICK|nr:hypothetical protein [Candidatus Fokinia solitaria]AWD33132.1 hypothetical protein Fsol_00334 [Candidatus Fokinia solitaria]